MSNDRYSVFNDDFDYQIQRAMRHSSTKPERHGDDMFSETLYYGSPDSGVLDRGEGMYFWVEPAWMSPMWNGPGFYERDSEDRTQYYPMDPEDFIWMPESTYQMLRHKYFPEGVPTSAEVLEYMGIDDEELESIIYRDTY